MSRLLYGKEEMAKALTSLAGSGETVTPTALAFLKAAGAEFGPWPEMIIERQALAYGTKVFTDVPNGAIFAWGHEQKGPRR